MITRFVLACVFSVFIILAVGVFFFYNQVQKLWEPSQVLEVELVLPPGTSFRDFLEILEDAGIIRDQWLLEGYARWNGLDNQIKSGRYRFGPNWSPVQVLEQAVKGPNAYLRYTLAPGLNLREIAKGLQTSNWIDSASKMLEICEKPPDGLPSFVKNYEGLMGPDTYYFDTQEPIDRVVGRLHELWGKQVKSWVGTNDLEVIMDNGMNLYENIILASIIEKEAASEIDMATVSSVFHNRLSNNWTLGAVAPLRYAMDHWEGYDHELSMDMDSPYNTYKIKGLPPTPICMPSKTALLAALNPPTTPYFFFVNDGKGGLIFTEKLNEHNNAVKEYRKSVRTRDLKAPSVKQPEK